MAVPVISAHLEGGAADLRPIAAISIFTFLGPERLHVASLISTRADENHPVGLRDFFSESVACSV
jgi:hypothetical protein